MAMAVAVANDNATEDEKIISTGGQTFMLNVHFCSQKVTEVNPGRHDAFEQICLQETQWSGTKYN